MAAYTALMNIEVDTKKAVDGLNSLGKNLGNLEKTSKSTSESIGKLERKSASSFKNLSDKAQRSLEVFRRIDARMKSFSGNTGKAFTSLNNTAKTSLDVFRRMDKRVKTLAGTSNKSLTALNNISKTLGAMNRRSRTSALRFKAMADNLTKMNKSLNANLAAIGKVHTTVEAFTKHALGNMSKMIKGVNDQNQKYLTLVKRTMKENHDLAATIKKLNNQFNMTKKDIGELTSKLNRLEKAYDKLSEGLKKKEEKDKKQTDLFTKLNKMIAKHDYLMMNLVSTIVTLIKVNLVGYLVQVTDQFILIQNRIRLVNADTQVFAQNMSAVKQIAMETRQALFAVANLYSRVGRNSEELSKNSAALALTVSTIAKSFQIAGATAEEARNAIVQLSQALASGRLQGDELRSILELAPTLAQSISKSIGISLGSLRTFASQGMITTDIITTAVRESASEIDKEFKKIVPTITQGIQNIKTAFQIIFGENKAIQEANAATANSFLRLADALKNLADSPAVTALGNFLKFLGERIPQITVAIVSFTASFIAIFGAGYLISGIVKLTKAFISLRAAMLGATAGAALFKAITNPMGLAIGALISALGVATYSYFSLDSAIEESSKTFREADEVIADVNKSLKDTEDQNIRTAAQVTALKEEMNKANLIIEQKKSRLNELKTEFDSLSDSMVKNMGMWAAVPVKMGSFLTKGIDVAVNSLEALFTWDKSKLNEGIFGRIGGKNKNNRLTNWFMEFFDTPERKKAIGREMDAVKAEIASIEGSVKKFEKKIEDMVGSGDGQTAEEKFLAKFAAKLAVQKAIFEAEADLIRKTIDMKLEKPFSLRLVPAQSSIDSFATGLSKGIAEAITKNIPEMRTSVGAGLIAGVLGDPSNMVNLVRNSRSFGEFQNSAVFKQLQQEIMKKIGESEEYKKKVDKERAIPQILEMQIAEKALEGLKNLYLEIADSQVSAALEFKNIIREQEKSNEAIEMNLEMEKEKISILGDSEGLKKLELKYLEKEIDARHKILLEEYDKKDATDDELRKIKELLATEKARTIALKQATQELEKQAQIFADLKTLSDENVELGFGIAALTAELNLLQKGAGELEIQRALRLNSIEQMKHEQKIKLANGDLDEEGYKRAISLIDTKNKLLEIEEKLTKELAEQRDLQKSKQELERERFLNRVREQETAKAGQYSVGDMLLMKFGLKESPKKARDEMIGRMEDELTFLQDKGAKISEIALDRSGKLMVSEAARKRLGEGFAESHNVYLQKVAEDIRSGNIKTTFSGAKKFFSKLLGLEDSFAKGGMVNGPSHSQGGVKGFLYGNPIELEGGEYIIKKDSVAKYGVPIFDALNTQKFQVGGLSNDQPWLRGPLEIKKRVSQSMGPTLGAGFKSYSQGDAPKSANFRSVTADDLIVGEASKQTIKANTVTVAPPKYADRSKGFVSQGTIQSRYKRETAFDITAPLEEQMYGQQNSVMTILASQKKAFSDEIKYENYKKLDSELISRSRQNPEKFKELTKALEGSADSLEELSGNSKDAADAIAKIKEKYASVARDWREIPELNPAGAAYSGDMYDPVNTELGRLQGGKSGKKPTSSAAEDEEGLLDKIFGSLALIAFGPTEEMGELINLTWDLLNQNERFNKAREKFEKLFLKVFDGLAEGLGFILDAIYNAIYPLVPLFEAVAGFLRDFIRSFASLLDPLYMILEAMTPVIVYITGAMQMIIGFISLFIGSVTDLLNDIFGQLFGMGDQADEWKSLNLLRAEAEIIQEIEMSLEGMVDILKDIEDVLYEITSSSLNLAAPSIKLEDAKDKYDELYASATRLTASEQDITAFTSFAKEYLQFAQDVLKSSSAYENIYEQVLVDISNVKSRLADEVGSEIETVIRKAVYDLMIVNSDLGGYLQELVDKYNDQVIGYGDFVELISYKLQQIEEDIDLKTFADWGQVAGSNIGELVESYGDFVERELSRFNQARKGAISSSTLAEDLAYLYGVGVSEEGIYGTPDLSGVQPTIGTARGTTPTIERTEDTPPTFDTIGGGDGNIFQSIIDAISEALQGIFDTIGAAVLAVWTPVEDAWHRIITWVEEDFLTFDLAAEWAAVTERFQLPDLATLDWSVAEANWQALTNSLNLPDLQDLDWSDIQAWWSGDAAQGIKGVTEKLNLPDLADLDWSDLQDWWSGNEAKGIKGLTEQLNLPDLADLDWSDLQAWWSGDEAKGIKGITEKLGLPDLSDVDLSIDVSDFQTKLNNIWSDFTSSFNIDTSGWSFDFDFDVFSKKVQALFMDPEREDGKIGLFWNPFRQFVGGPEYLIEFAEGGLAYGPSHEMGGIKATVGKNPLNMIELEGGEYIIKKRTVEKYGHHLLDRVNQGKADIFANGGEIPRYDNGGTTIDDRQRGTYANSSPYKAYLQAKASGHYVGGTRLTIGDMIANERTNPVLLAKRADGDPESLVYPNRETEVELVNASLAVGGFGKDLLKSLSLPYGIGVEATFPHTFEGGLFFGGGGMVPVKGDETLNPTTTDIGIGVSSTKTAEGYGLRTTKGESAWGAKLNKAFTNIIWGEQSNGIDGILDMLGYAFNEIWGAGLRAVNFIGDVLYGPRKEDTYDRGYGPFGADIEPSYHKEYEENEIFGMKLNQAIEGLWGIFAVHAGAVFLNDFFKQAENYRSPYKKNATGIDNPWVQTFSRIWSLGTYDYVLDNYGEGWAAASTFIGPILGTILFHALSERPEKETRERNAKDTQYVDYEDIINSKATGGMVGGLAVGPSHQSGMLGLDGGGSPFLFEGGEYIVSKKAVNSIGVPYLDYLNKTGMPSYEPGGGISDWGAPEWLVAALFVKGFFQMMDDARDAIRDRRAEDEERERNRNAPPPSVPGIPDDTVENVIKELTIGDDRYIGTLVEGIDDYERIIVKTPPNVTYDKSTGEWAESDYPLSYTSPEIADKRYVQNILSLNAGLQNNDLNQELRTHDVGQIFYGDYRRENSGIEGYDYIYQTPAQYMTGRINNGQEGLFSIFNESWKDIYLLAWHDAALSNLRGENVKPRLASAILTYMMGDYFYDSFAAKDDPSLLKIWSDYPKDIWKNYKDTLMDENGFNTLQMYAGLELPGLKSGGVVDFSDLNKTYKESASGQPESEKPKMSTFDQILATAAILSIPFSLFDTFYTGDPLLAFAGYNPFFSLGAFGEAASSHNLVANYLANLASLTVGIAGLEALAVHGFNNPPMTPAYSAPKEEEGGGGGDSDSSPKTTDAYRRITNAARAMSDPYSAIYGGYQFEYWLEDIFADVRDSSDNNKYRNDQFAFGLLSTITNSDFHLEKMGIKDYDWDKALYLFALNSVFASMKWMNALRYDIFDRMFSGPSTVNNGVSYDFINNLMPDFWGLAYEEFSAIGWDGDADQDQLAEFGKGYGYGLHLKLADLVDTGQLVIPEMGAGGLAVGPSHQSGMLGMTKSGSPFLFEGGEYIINKKSAEKIGVSNLNKLNSYGLGGSILENMNFESNSSSAKKEEEERRGLNVLDWLEVIAALVAAGYGAYMIDSGTGDIAKKRVIAPVIDDIFGRGTAFSPTSQTFSRNIPLGIAKLLGGTFLAYTGVKHAFDLIQNGKPKEAEKKIIELKEGFEETPEEKYGPEVEIIESVLLDYYNSKNGQRQRLDLLTAGSFRAGGDYFLNEKDWHFAWSGDGGFMDLASRMNPKEESILSQLYGGPFRVSSAISVDDLVVLNDNLKDLEHEVTIPDFFFPRRDFDPITGEEIKSLELISGEKGTYRYNGTGPSDYLAPFTLDTFWTFYEDRLVRPIYTSMLYPEGDGYNEFINELMINGKYNDHSLEDLAIELDHQRTYKHGYQRFGTAFNLPYLNLVFSDHHSVGIGGIPGQVTEEEIIEYWNEFYERKSDRGYHVQRSGTHLYGTWRDRSDFPNSWPEYGLLPYFEENNTFLNPVGGEGWGPATQSLWTVIYNKIQDNPNLGLGDLPTFWGPSNKREFSDQGKLGLIPMVNWAMYDATMSDWQNYDNEFKYEWDEYGSGGLVENILNGITQNPLGALELLLYGYGAYQGASMSTYGYKDVTGGAINVPPWMADYSGALAYNEATSGLLKMTGGLGLAALSAYLFSEKLPSFLGGDDSSADSSPEQPKGRRIDPDPYIPDGFPFPPSTPEPEKVLSALESYYHSFDSSSKTPIDPLFMSALYSASETGMYPKPMNYVFSGETGFNSFISRMTSEERGLYEELVGSNISNRRSVSIYDLMILDERIKNEDVIMESDPFAWPGLEYLSSTAKDPYTYRGMGISDFLNSFGLDTVWSYHAKDFASSGILSFLYGMADESYTDFMLANLLYGTEDNANIISSKSNFVKNEYDFLNRMSRSQFEEYILGATGVDFSDDYISQYYKTAEELGLDRSVSISRYGMNFTKNFPTRSELGAGGEIPSYSLGGLVSDLFNLDFTERDNFIFDTIAVLSLMSGGYSALAGEGFASGFIGAGATLGLTSLATSGFKGSPLGESDTLINRDDENAKRNAILAAFGLTLLADQGMGMAIQNALFTGLIANTSPENTRAGSIFSSPSANQFSSSQFLPEFGSIFDLIELFYYIAEGAVVNTKKNFEILEAEGAATFLSNMAERAHNGKFAEEVENAIGGILGWGQGRFIYNYYKKYAGAREPYDPLFAYQLWKAGVLTQQQSQDMKFVWDTKKPFASLGFFSKILGVGDANNIAAMTILDTAHIMDSYVSDSGFVDPYTKEEKVGAKYMGKGFENEITGGPLRTLLWDLYADLNTSGDYLGSLPPGILMSHEAAHYPQYLRHGGSGSELERIQNFLYYYVNNPEKYEGEARQKGEYDFFKYMRTLNSVGYTDYRDVLSAAAKHPTMFKRSGAGNTYSSGIDYLVWRLADGDETALRNWISINGGDELNNAYAPFVQRGIKQFGQGGLAVGPSHQSGMLGMTKSGSPFLFEGGEYIINKKSTEKLGTGFLNNLNSYEGGGLTPLEQYYSMFGGGALEFSYPTGDGETEVTEGASGLFVSTSFLGPQPVFLPNIGTAGNFVSLYDMGPYYQQKLYDITKKATLESGIAIEAGKAARVAAHTLENVGVAIQGAIGAAMGYYMAPALPYVGQAGTAAYFGYKNVHQAVGGTTHQPDMPSQATGGYLTGPSHANGGILLEAEGGEYIINKRSVDKYGLSIFEALNQGTWAGKFPVGGLATYTDINMSGRRDLPTVDPSTVSGGTSSGGLTPTGVGYGGYTLSSGSVISPNVGSGPMLDYGGQFLEMDEEGVLGPIKDNYMAINDFYTGVAEIQDLGGSVQMAYDVFDQIPAIGFGGGGAGGGLLGGLEYAAMEGIKQLASNDLGGAITEFLTFPKDTWKKWMDQYFPGIDLESALETNVEEMEKWGKQFVGDIEDEWKKIVDEYELDDWVTFCEEKVKEFETASEDLIDELYKGYRGVVDSWDEEEWQGLTWVNLTNFQAEADKFIAKLQAGYSNAVGEWDEEGWQGLTWVNLTNFQADADVFIGKLQTIYSNAVTGWDEEGFTAAAQANVQAIVNIASNLLSHAVATINSATGILPAMGIGFIPNPLAEGRLGGLFGNLVPNWIKSRDNLIDIQMPGGVFQNTEDLGGEGKKDKDKKERGGHLSYQSGGFALGPSHAQGGIPGIVAGKYPIEFEGGEYIINKKTVDTLGTGFFDYINSVKAEDGFDTRLLFDSFYKSSIGFGSPISDILSAFRLPSRLGIELNAVTTPGYPFELGGNSLLATNFPIFKINRNIGKDLARKLNLGRMMESGGAVKYAWGGLAPKFGLGSLLGSVGGALLSFVSPDIKAELGFGIPRGLYGSAGLSWSLENGGYLADGGGIGGLFAGGGSTGFNSFGMGLISEVGSGSSLNASLLRELIYVLREKDLSVTFVDESGDEIDEGSMRLRRQDQLQYRRAEELA